PTSHVHHVTTISSLAVASTTGAAVTTSPVAATTSHHATHHVATHHSAHHSAHAAARATDRGRRGVTQADLANFEHQVGIATVGEELLYFTLINLQSHADWNALRHCEICILGTAALHFCPQVIAGDRFEHCIDVSSIGGIDHWRSTSFAHPLHAIAAHLGSTTITVATHRAPAIASVAPHHI